MQTSKSFISPIKTELSDHKNAQFFNFSMQSSVISLINKFPVSLHEGSVDWSRLKWTNYKDHRRPPFAVLPVRFS